MFEVPQDADPDAVRRGPSSGSPSTPSLSSRARIVEAAEHIAGPWTSGALRALVWPRASGTPALAKRIASEAVRRFEPELERPVVLDVPGVVELPRPQPG